MKLQSYLQKLVLYIALEVGEGKPFSKNFYKFQKHETGWRFLADLHNKNRFASRKKLRRKQHKSYTNSFLSIYRINADIIEIEENQNVSFYGHFSSCAAKFQNWVLKKLQNFSKKVMHLAKVSETDLSFLNIPSQNSMKYKRRIYNLFNKSESSDQRKSMIDDDV